MVEKITMDQISMPPVGPSLAKDNYIFGFCSSGYQAQRIDCAINNNPNATNSSLRRIMDLTQTKIDHIYFHDTDPSKELKDGKDVDCKIYFPEGLFLSPVDYRDALLLAILDNSQVLADKSLSKDHTECGCVEELGEKYGWKPIQSDVSPAEDVKLEGKYEEWILKDYTRGTSINSTITPLGPFGTAVMSSVHESDVLIYEREDGRTSGLELSSSPLARKIIKERFDEEAVTCSGKEHGCQCDEIYGSSDIVDIMFENSEAQVTNVFMDAPDGGKGLPKTSLIEIEAQGEKHIINTHEEIAYTQSVKLGKLMLKPSEPKTVA